VSIKKVSRTQTVNHATKQGVTLTGRKTTGPPSHAVP